MSDPNSTPTIHRVKRHAGIAGQYAIEATVSYPDEPRETVTFVGSVYGGPVVMRTPSGMETFVSEPGRFGEFGESWVRAFFA
jgi:hypothetical protein